MSLPVSASLVGGKTISKVHVNVSSGIYFVTNERMLDPEGCGSDGYYKLMKGSDYEKEAYSMLLSARIAVSKVSFYISGCESGYPKVTYINTHD